jgi:uncharacterized protein
METKIDIRMNTDFELKDAILINAFPGPGYAAMLAANYIIDKMDFEPVGTVRSPEFPSTAVIHDYTPYHPMRFYGKDGLIILLTEMAPKPEMAKSIAESLLTLYKEKGLKQIINLEAIVDTQGKPPEEHVFYGVTTLEGERKALEKAKIELFKEGMITGIAGELLSEGHSLEYNILCLLTEVNPMYPDVQAAIRFVENLNTLLDNLNIDLEDLKKEAEELQGTIQESIDKAKELMDSHQQQDAQGLPVPAKPPSYMYG